MNPRLRICDWEFLVGNDLATILATLGAVQAGDGNHFSIGGPPDKSLPVVGGLLGQPRGISNAHNRCEGDASPARGDLYQLWESKITTASPQHPSTNEKLAAKPISPKCPSSKVYTTCLATSQIPTTTSVCSVIMPRLAVRRQIIHWASCNLHKCKSNHGPDRESVAQNPYYFRGFFGLLIPPGTHAFIVRMFANNSAANPDRVLGRDTLKSFYAMGGPDIKLVYSPGNEGIPENWHTHAADDLYTVPLIDMDLSALFQQHPELVAFGGTTGTVNSFTGLNIANLTVSFPRSASSKEAIANPACTGWCLQCGNAPPRQQFCMLPVPIHRCCSARSDSPNRRYCGRAGCGGQDQLRGSSGNRRAWVSAAKQVRLWSQPAEQISGLHEIDGTGDVLNAFTSYQSRYFLHLWLQRISARIRVLHFWTTIAIQKQFLINTNDESILRLSLAQSLMFSLVSAWLMSGLFSIGLYDVSVAYSRWI